MRRCIPAKERLDITSGTSITVYTVNNFQASVMLFRQMYMELRHESHNMNKHLPIMSWKSIKTQKPPNFACQSCFF
jgi:hypothetical protein